MKLLLVFAHPDDETFSSSGTIIQLVKQGFTAKLIMATRGEAGMLGDPPLATRETLGKVREQELREASKITGISQIYFLDFIDGTLHKVSQKKLQAEILPIMKKEKPHMVITFEKNGISMHPDHKAISKAATESFFEYMKTAKHHVRLYHVVLPRSNLKRFEKAGFKYGFFGKMEGTPDEEITTKVDISRVYRTKMKAMMCHKTQQPDWERLLKRAKLLKGRYEYFTLIAENYINSPK
ncbi:PIG-L family deacetylase [Candidatus Roizmanbacteria bacterium]|nr:PIG-L family deacetylase [Candidatus Roizmanbacteria bacterium]